MTSTIAAHDAELSITGSTAAHAQLVVQLAQLGTSMNIDRGQALLYKHRTEGLTFEKYEELYPVGEPDSIAILNVLKWHETVGTLVKQGLLDRDLVLDWLWVSGSWQLCRLIALAQREETGVAAMWENFEALAAAQTD